MFPVVKLRVRGLESRSIYSIELEFVRTCRTRMKFADGAWTPGSSNEESIATARWRHPESPNYGYHWMSSELSFAKIKMTNKTDNKNCVALSSLYKYHVRIIILKLDDNIKTTEKVIKTVSFPVTEFIAVTSYQNTEVTQLKIQYNPFAKAFQQPRNILPSSTNETFHSSQNQEKESENSSAILSQALVNRMMTSNEEFSTCRSQMATSPISSSCFPSPLYAFQDSDLMRLRHQQNAMSIGAPGPLDNKMMTSNGEFSTCKSQMATSPISASCFPSPLYGFQDSDLMRLRHQQNAMSIGAPGLNTRFEDVYPQYFRMMDEQSRHSASSWSPCSRISGTSPVIDHQTSAMAYSSGNSSILHNPTATYPHSRTIQSTEPAHQAVVSSGVNQWNPVQHISLGSNTFPVTNSTASNCTEETKMEVSLPPMETNYTHNSSPSSVNETTWSSASSSPNCTYQPTHTNSGIQTFL